MAVFVGNFAAVYSAVGVLSADLPAGITADDSDPGSTTFEAGETLTITPGNVPATYEGVITINGETFVAYKLGGSSDIRVIGNVPDPNTFTPDPTIDPNNIDDTTPFTVCFAAGTLIATPEGERAVETLAIGDLVTTADLRAVPVKWIGRQTLHRFFTPADRFEPVRVAAGALGAGLPHTDLVLTADHALILDGFAVNAGALVNGTTITREPGDRLPERVTYYHVETEGHDVILANGAPAETYIDYVGRRAFDNHAEYVALYGDEPVIAEMPLPRISSRRQLPAEIRERFGISDFSADVTSEALVFLTGRGAA